jgi:hypothetical protein
MMRRCARERRHPMELAEETPTHCRKASRH